MSVEGAILPPMFNSAVATGSNGIPVSPARFRTNNVQQMSSMGLTSSPSTSGMQNFNNSPTTQNSQNFQTSAPPAGSGPPGTGNQVNMVSYMPRPAYRFKPQIAPQNATDVEGYGRRLRRNMAQVRRHIDCVASVLNYLENRVWQNGSPNERPFIHPHILYSTDSYPPIYCPDKPIDCVTTKFVRAAMNKVKCPIYDVCWTPEGRRLVTGASSGEFTLWNGTAFNFETILQAHDSAVRAMKWSRNDMWMVTADHDGFVKYWQANMNNVTMFQAHKEAVRSLSFCPGDAKFATASDDGTVRVWDFMRCHEERIFRGHGSDVRCVDWHPNKALLVSGSRDSQQPVKLWDAKSGQCLATLHDHKNAVMAVQWNANGNWMVSASRDHLIKLYDIRMMKEVTTFRGHKKEVTSLSWHPIHECLLVSGGADGSMMFWLVGNEREVGLMETAHEQAVWCLKWHPLGHILASGSNDNNTKFWTRNKPGDLLEDFYGMTGNNPFDLQHSTTAPAATAASRQQPAAPHFDEASDHRQGATSQSNTNNQPTWERKEGAAPIPGMGLSDEVMDSLRSDDLSSGIPGLGGGLPGLGGIESDGGQLGRKTLLKQPPPKKAQRQFERTWNVSSQFVPDFEDLPPMGDADYRKMKPSLLGNAPPMMDMPMNNAPPPMMNREPPMHMGGPPQSMPDWNSHQHQGPPMMDPWLQGPPVQPPHHMMNPPPSQQQPQQQFFGGGDEPHWQAAPQQQHGDVDLRHQMAPPPWMAASDMGYDNYYNNPPSEQQHQSTNPRDPRTQRRGATSSDAMFGNLPSTTEYQQDPAAMLASGPSSRDPRSASAARYQQQQQAAPLHESRMSRHDSKDEYSPIDDDRQPTNPKRKWKQTYEAEEAQEKQWHGSEDEMLGDVDERQLMSRNNRPRRRYN